MLLSITKDKDYILGRKYNVEFLQGNGKHMTFNNVLENVDNTYFWFSSKEDGLACVRQDRIVFMYCTDKLKPTDQNKIIHTFQGHDIEEIKSYFAYLIDVQDYGFTEALYIVCRKYGIYYHIKLIELLLDRDKEDINNISACYNKTRFISMYLRNLSLHS